jgi:tetratricopeptide (TPR) repeat protein
MIKGTNNIAALKAFIIATEHIYNLNTREAIKYLMESIALDSSFVSPRIWLVSYLYQMGRLEEAQYHLEISKKFESKSTLVEQIMIGWAEAFINNDLEKQIHFLKMGLKYFPQNSIALYQIAGVYAMEENYSEALKYYEQIFKMKWPFSTAYCSMAYCQLKLGQNHEAIDVLDFALDLKPLNKDIYLLLEIAYDRIGEKENANKYQNLYSRKITSLGISEKEGLENSATTKHELGNIEGAITDYGQIMNSDPAEWGVLEKIGDLYLIKLDTITALSKYERILRGEELNASVNLKLAKIYDAKRDTASALKYYNSFIKADPSKQDTSILERINQLKK